MQNWNTRETAPHRLVGALGRFEWRLLSLENGNVNKRETAGFRGDGSSEGSVDRDNERLFQELSRQAMKELPDCAAASR